MSENPPWWGRYYAWVLISLISFFFAEIISGSSMIRSFDPGTMAGSFIWSGIITIPLYGLHAIALAWIVYRFGKPRLYTLFLAGVIFGLYEAYITKVLWIGWGPDTMWYLGGIAVVETTTLLLFWHPFMAFIIPLFASESILSRSRETLAGLPHPLRWLLAGRKRTYATLLAFTLFCGINVGGQSPGPLNAVVSILLAFVVFTPLLFAYRRLGLHRYTIRQLLPRKWEVVVIFWLLALIYLFGIVFIRPEMLPGLWPQALVWLMYAVAIVLLYFSLRKSKRVETPTVDFPVPLSKKLYLAFFFSAIVSTIAVSLIPFRIFIVLAFLVAGTAVGAGMLTLSIGDLLRHR